MIQAGQHDRAWQLCLALAPLSRSDDPRLLHAYGLLSLGRGDLSQAVDALNASLAKDPDNAIAHYHLGRALRARGDLSAALDHYDRALVGDPFNWEAHTSRGTLLRALGRVGESVAAQRLAVHLQPRAVEVHLNLANALFASNALAEAITAYENALRLQANHAKARRGLQIAVAMKFILDKRWSDARQAHLQLIDQYPDIPTLHIGLGISLWFLGDLDRAHRAFEQAHLLNPEDGAACLHLGALLNERGIWNEALHWLAMAEARLPGVAAPMVESGVALQALGQIEDALEKVDAAIALDPRIPAARYNRGILRLTLGRMESGYADFESRYAPGIVYPDGRPHFAMPPWQGEALEGRHLLVWAEQGLGDTLQFVRYLPALAQLAGVRLSICVQRPLLRLLSESFPALPIAGDYFATDGAAEFECALMSLPLRLGMAEQRLPIAVPYLHAPAALCAHWRHRLGDRVRPRVGLAWAGNPAHSRDAIRSIPLGRFAPLIRALAANERCEFHVLQKGEGLRQRDDLAELPMQPSSDHCEDFADTAALIAQLDLVITVDTSVAHLAAAMGRPTWILLPYVPDWRYELGKEECMWYPTARLFRQPRQGDWDSVLAVLQDALEHWLTVNGGRDIETPLALGTVHPA